MHTAIVVTRQREFQMCLHQLRLAYVLINVAFITS